MADILQKVFSNDFLNKNISIVVKISVKFGTNGLMDNTSALVSAFAERISLEPVDGFSPKFCGIA